MKKKVFIFVILVCVAVASVFAISQNGVQADIIDEKQGTVFVANTSPTKKTVLLSGIFHVNVGSHGIVNKKLETKVLELEPNQRLSVSFPVPPPLQTTRPRVIIKGKPIGQMPGYINYTLKELRFTNVY